MFDKDFTDAAAACPGMWEELCCMVDGELDPLEAEKVREHIKACAECAEAYHFLEATSTTFSNLEMAAPPAGLRDRILAETTRRPTIAQRFVGWQRGLAYGALAVAATALIFFTTRPGALTPGKHVGEEASAHLTGESIQPPVPPFVKAVSNSARRVPKAAVKPNVYDISEPRIALAGVDATRPLEKIDKVSFPKRSANPGSLGMGSPSDPVVLAASVPSYKPLPASPIVAEQVSADVEDPVVGSEAKSAPKQPEPPKSAVVVDTFTCDSPEGDARIKRLNAQLATMQPVRIRSAREISGGRSLQVPVIKVRF